MLAGLVVVALLASFALLARLAPGPGPVAEVPAPTGALVSSAAAAGATSAGGVLTPGSGQTSNSVPAYFLPVTAFDNSGYWITTADARERTIGAQTLGVPGCGADAARMSGQATAQTYRSRPAPSAGSASAQEWRVTETVLQVPARSLASAKEAITKARNCQSATSGQPGGLSVSRPGTEGAVLITYLGTSTHASRAEATTLVADRLVVLTIFPGEGPAPGDIPGGLAWVGQLTEAARSVVSATQAHP